MWNEVAAPPITGTAFVPILGQLLAVGGLETNNKTTTAIYMYNAIKDSWEIVSHMPTPRCYSFAAVLSDNQLMVVGGYTEKSIPSKTVQIASVSIRF